MTAFTRVIHGIEVCSAQPIPWGTSSGERDRRILLRKEPPVSPATGLGQGEELRHPAWDEPVPNEIAALRPPLPGYSIGWQGKQLVIRFFSGSEFTFDGEQLSVRTAEQVPEELVELLLPNAVLSAVLGSDSQLVLHASAVALGPHHTLAICGRSGAGKSSLATMLTRQGASLVTDDALRCQSMDGTIGCYRGGTELRLRRGAEHLIAHATGERRRLLDGRVGYRPALGPSFSRLSAIWMPKINAADSRPRWVRLRGQEALSALLGSLRTFWSPIWMPRLLPQLSRVAQQVALYRVELPKGLLEEEPAQRCLFEQAELMTHAR